MRYLTDEVNVSELLEMRKQGMRNSEIAASLDVSRQTIYNLIGADGMGRGRAKGTPNRAKIVSQEPQEQHKAVMVETEHCTTMGNDKRKYTLHRSDKDVWVDVSGESGQQMTVMYQEIDAIIGELQAIRRKWGDNPLLKLEVV